MKVFFILIFTLSVFSCASNKSTDKDRVTVTGERVSRDSVELVKSDKKETIGGLMGSFLSPDFMTSTIKKQGFTNPEKLMSFKDCQSLIEYISTTNIAIADLTDIGMLLISKQGGRLNMEFKDGGCLQKT